MFSLTSIIKVRGLSFTDAVETLCGNCPLPVPERPRENPTKPFELPKAAFVPSSMVPYLQDRGIDPEIIRECMEAGILYESKKHQNCVFVGKDLSGKPRFACLRGTKGDFKQDVSGSDKRFSFFLPARVPDCPRLAVAESPIDALSLATLEKRTTGNWRDCSYLSLGGTADRALMQFLRDHQAITQISLCLDNDKAGMRGMERLEASVREDPELSRRVKLIFRNPPPEQFGKDYNEFLVSQKRNRHQRAASRSR